MYMDLYMGNIMNNEYISNFLIENYEERGPTFCAESLGVKNSTIRSKAHRMGLKVNSQTISDISSKNANKLWKNRDLVDKYSSVKVDQFINVGTERCAYILGFLWGDGYLNNKSQSHLIRLEIIADDFDDIHKSFLQTGKWNVIFRNRKDRKKQAVASCNSKLIYKHLESIGYLDKSHVDPKKALMNVRDNFRYHWWRGFFDADGCFYINKKNYVRQMSFSGSYYQDWSSLLVLFGELGIEKYQLKRNINKKSRSSGVYLYRKSDIILFGEYIYQDSPVFFLKRKFNKFVELSE